MATITGAALGGALKETREKRGLTQEQLAAKADVTVRMLQKYEAGKPRPTYENLFKLCTALGVPVEELIAPMYQAWQDSL